MGRKIFISYKYHDSNVKQLDSIRDRTTIVRDYVDVLEQKIDRSNHIFKGESNDEDMSILSDETIWLKLKNRIYDSSVTIVFISPMMKEENRSERNQWIPWEISYSLKEIPRLTQNGDSITSMSNAILGVLLPDRNNSYNYFYIKNSCCNSGCVTYKTSILFKIIIKNIFNLKNANKRKCINGSTIWVGEHSYIEIVKWEEFYNNINKYIDRAVKRKDENDNYDIVKEVQ